MNTFTDQKLDPEGFCDQLLPTFSKTSAEAAARSPTTDSITYAGLLHAVIILSIVIVLLLAYIFWNYVTTRTNGRNACPSSQMEQGTKAHHNHSPQTPSTVVGIDHSHRKQIYMSRDESSPHSPSSTGQYRGPPFQFFISSPAESAFSPPPKYQGREMPSIGSQIMVRETTGDFPMSVDIGEGMGGGVDAMRGNVGLGLEGGAALERERSPSRSSLYTIVETDGETSTNASQEVSSPVTALSTHARLSAIPL